MEIKDGEIIKARDDELYGFWLTHWSDVYSYTEYKDRVKALGTKVIENDDN